MEACDRCGAGLKGLHAQLEWVSGRPVAYVCVSCATKIVKGMNTLRVVYGIRANNRVRFIPRNGLMGRYPWWVDGVKMAPPW